MCDFRDPYIQQSSPAACAVKCQQIILCHYGIYVTEQELCDIGISNGWYDEKRGMHLRDNGKLLGCFGVEYHHSQNNKIEDIRREIDSGHCVMVSLNHSKLNGGDDIYGQAAHAVIIRSVEPDGVIITDPSTGNAARSCEAALFTEAWQDSDFYMLSTTQKATYVYDPHQKQMIENN